MRSLGICAFVLDGAAAVGFVATIALGEGRMTPVNGLILGALLLGFFSALAWVMQMDQAPVEEAAVLVLSGAALFDRLPEPAKRDLRRHFPPTIPVSGPAADPSDHLAILTRPSFAAGAVPERAQ